MPTPHHPDSDDQEQIQMRVHKIAKHWLDRDYCPACTVRNILLGAMAVGTDVLDMSRSDLHQMVDFFFDADTQHVQH